MKVPRMQIGAAPRHAAADKDAARADQLTDGVRYDQPRRARRAAAAAEQGSTAYSQAVGASGQQLVRAPASRRRPKSSSLCTGKFTLLCIGGKIGNVNRHANGAEL